MEFLAHGITPLMRGLILQLTATGLPHSPAATRPKTRPHLGGSTSPVPLGSSVVPGTRKLPTAGHPNVNLLAPGRDGTRMLKEKEHKIYTESACRDAATRRALGSCVPIPGGAQPPGKPPRVGPPCDEDPAPGGML